MPTPNFHIEKLVNGGFGLSHDQDGKVVLIEDVIAGEIVNIQVYKQSNTHQRAKATHIHKPSAARIEPPCNYAKQCGGCTFQHMDYPEQLRAKENIIHDLFTRSRQPPHSPAIDDILAPPIGAVKHFHYRQRIRLQVDPNNNLCFFKRHSNTSIPVTHCKLAHPAINTVLSALHLHHAFPQLLQHCEALELLLNPATQRIILLLHFVRKPRPTDKQHAKVLKEEIDLLEQLFFYGTDFAASGNAVLSWTFAPLKPYTTNDITLFWESGGFCQVNLKQNIQLIQTVLTYCSVTPKDTVLDLFCGMGNFSIPLAEQAQSLLGIEGQGSAIRSAKKNSVHAHQQNTHFRKQPVHEACLDMVKDGTRFDIVVIDPPRQGVPELAKQLAKLTKKRLVYISCDPATLCRDLAELQKQGFQLAKLQPIDMFPQTHHIECVALLEKVS